ncbi:MAG: head GIN domain-containing protein [Sphingobacteriales bacterium]
MKKLKGLLIVFFALTATQAVFAAQATDSLSTIEPHVSNFDKLKIEGPVDIQIVQGTTESLKITAPTEVIDRIVAEVTGNTLNIRNKHDNWSQSEKSWYGDKSVWQKKHYRIKAWLTVNMLKSISLSGSGTAKFAEGIKADNLELRLRGSGNMEGKIDTHSLITTISGSGNIKLSGNANNSRLKVSGSGVFAAPELLTSSSNVHVSGSGDAKINASDNITAGVSGSGRVNYTGAVKNVMSTTSGSGSIRRF